MNNKPSLRKRAGLEIFRQLRKNLITRHELKCLFWECTLRCNMNCRHCGSDCKKIANCPDMPVTDFLSVIDSITPHVNPNKLLVIFTGGEALVRTDLETCGLALYQRGYPWGVVTNGLLLTRERLDSLVSAGMHTLTVSLDGFEEEHNWMRRNPRSYETVVQAIKMLTQEKELVWDIVTCANPRNIESLDKFKEFLIRLGVKAWRIFTVFPVGRGAVNTDLQLNNQQFREVFEFIKRTRKEGRIKVSYGCEGFLGDYETEVRDNFFYCSAGINTASVLADGSISGCASIRSDFHQGNIYETPFMEIWENRFQKYRNREWMKKGECKDCTMFRYCEGNGMHLRDEKEELLFCHYHRLNGDK